MAACSPAQAVRARLSPLFSAGWRGLWRGASANGLGGLLETRLPRRQDVGSQDTCAPGPRTGSSFLARPRGLTSAFWALTPLPPLQGAVFALEFEEEEEPGAAADDSNDICILPSDNSGQVSPPESPTVAAPWQAESLPVSLSASQSWHTESLPVSLGPESWQQIAVDPEELKSLDSNGAGENNSSNSDIVHVEREEVPEGAEGAPGPLLAHRPAPSSPGTRAPGPGAATPLPVQLGEEEVRAAAAPVGSEQEVPALEPPEAGPSPEPVRIAKGSLPEGPWSAGRGQATPPAEGKSVLLLGGAAAAALLAVAVGVALALRRK